MESQEKEYIFSIILLSLLLGEPENCYDENLMLSIQEK